VIILISFIDIFYLFYHQVKYYIQYTQNIDKTEPLYYNKKLNGVNPFHLHSKICFWRKERRVSMGIASLVLGIIAIIIGVFSIGILGWAGAVVGIIGIILGAIGRSTAPPEKRGMATAGLVCSIVGTILCLLFYIACVACIGGLASL
jgi:hypothetical protein